MSEKLSPLLIAYGTAKKRTPRRWSGDTKNWNPIGEVALNKRHPDLSTTEEVQH